MSKKNDKGKGTRPSIGGLIGRVEGEATIKNCKAEGIIITSGDADAGGIAGSVDGETEIRNSSSNVVIIRTAKDAFDHLRLQIDRIVTNPRDRTELLNLLDKTEGDHRNQSGKARGFLDRLEEKARKYPTLLSIVTQLMAILVASQPPGR